MFTGLGENGTPCSISLSKLLNVPSPLQNTSKLQDTCAEPGPAPGSSELSAQEKLVLGVRAVPVKFMVLASCGGSYSQMFPLCWQSALSTQQFVCKGI